MSASPADRFPSMRELISALRSQQTLVPRRGRVPAIAGLVVLGAGGILLGAWQLTRSDDPKPDKPVQIAAAKNLAPIATAIRNGSTL